MRRLTLALVSAMLVTIVAAGPASAAPPLHERFGPAPPETLAAGTVCDFAVTLATPVDLSKVSTWEYEDGTVRILVRGYASGTATANGLTYTHNGGFRIEIVINPDGSAEFSGSGTFFAWYFAGDPVVGLSEGLWAVSGHGSESYAPDGSLLVAEFTGGNAVDVCEALTPTGN